MGFPSNTNTICSSNSRGSLKRSETCWDLSAPAEKPQLSPPKPSFPPKPSYNRTLRHYKEQRDLSNRHKQRKPSASTTPSTSRSDAVRTPPPQSSVAPQSSGSSTPHQPTPHMPHAPRTSSPLCPTSSSCSSTNSYSCRRSSKKPAPDLYKQAIITRMRCNPEGARILHMGPRLALSIMEATKDLERLVGGLGTGLASSCGAEVVNGDSLSTDVVMSDHTSPPVLSQSWVVLNDEMQSISQSSWEMVY
ncbi:hypothetical protein V5O48_009153 [Marasmius crinis-equi]|uniref:Uncharacterized protein n=1 Tax=Marasmius crinis-equi TaxID=585013 RepID=A0ABR3FC25_9AGAR